MGGMTETRKMLLLLAGEAACLLAILLAAVAVSA